MLGSIQIKSESAVDDDDKKDKMNTCDRYLVNKCCIIFFIFESNNIFFSVELVYNATKKDRKIENGISILIFKINRYQIHLLLQL